MGEIINVPRGRRTADRPDWSVTNPTDVRACLTVLAEEGGNMKRTVERCANEGLYRASEWQLKKWRDDEHPKMWVDVHSENEKRLERIAEAKARENAIGASMAAAKAIAGIEGKLDGAELVDLAKALDSLIKAQAASTTAVLQWSGRPVQGGTGGSVADILGQLRTIAPALVVDGTLEDVTVNNGDETGER